MDNGKSESKGRPGKGKGANRKGKESINSNSETTIYRNLLEEVAGSDTEPLGPEDRQEHEQIERVDSEVAFKIRIAGDIAGQNLDLTPEQRRESSSSDDKIDTSDELMEVDQFIADC